MALNTHPIYGTEKTLDELRAIVERTREVALARTLEALEEAVRVYGYDVDYVDFETSNGPQVILSLYIPGIPLPPGFAGRDIEEAFRDLVAYLDSDRKKPRKPSIPPSNFPHWE